MTDSESSNNPFKPGFGRRPPYLAGRESHQARLATMLATASEEGLGETVIMYGPRGVGKTVLLNSFAMQARERQAVILRSTPSECGESTAHLAANLWRLAVGDSRWGSIAAWLPSILSLGLGAAGMGFLRPAKVAAVGRQDPPETSLAETLARACRRDGRPRVLLLDEAHTMSPEVARLLLNVAQETAAEAGAPFLLVLAGTPGLPSHLESVGATFVERAESLGVGLLDKSAAMAAIRVPLERGSMAMPDGLLAEVAEDAQRYPYFLQLWGKALWNQAREDGISQVDQALVERARTAVDGTREQFYDRRYQGMVEVEMIDAAVAVAAAFGADGGGMHMDQIRAGIERHLAGMTAGPGMDAAQRRTKAIAIGKELVRAGYIWQPPGTKDHIPGIPSLMTYVLEQAQKAPG